MCNPSNRSNTLDPIRLVASLTMGDLFMIQQKYTPVTSSWSQGVIETTPLEGKTIESTYSYQKASTAAITRSKKDHYSGRNYDTSTSFHKKNKTPSLTNLSYDSGTPAHEHQGRQREQAKFLHPTQEYRYTVRKRHGWGNKNTAKETIRVLYVHR